jgi:hypothetical protein
MATNHAESRIPRSNMTVSAKFYVKENGQDPEDLLSAPEREDLANRQSRQIGVEETS